MGYAPRFILLVEIADERAIADSHSPFLFESTAKGAGGPMIEPGRLWIIGDGLDFFSDLLGIHEARPARAGPMGHFHKLRVGRST